MPTTTKCDETTAKEFGWKKYTFRYRTHEGIINHATVYASDDHVAAILFDKAYGKSVAEVIS